MTLIFGDCLDVLPTLPAQSVDMVLCDLPYGTTGIACLNTGREFVGIENDPVHFATAKRRIGAALCEGLV